MTQGLRIEVTLPAPVEEVWPAFRDPALIRQWHGWEYDGPEGTLDDEIQLIYVDGAVVEEDGRSLHIGGHRFTFEAMGAQTIVRVTRATPPPDTGLDWDAMYDDVDEGWLSFLQQLRFALTHHWGEQRHTISLAGIAPAPTTPPASLGLDVDGEPGGRYAIDAVGEALTGDIWFRSNNQLGLTVDGWGPGLIILVDAPNRGGTAASATLTTYGPVDDDRTARWTAAWQAAYPG